MLFCLPWLWFYGVYLTQQESHEAEGPQHQLASQCIVTLPFLSPGLLLLCSIRHPLSHTFFLLTKYPNSCISLMPKLWIRNLLINLIEETSDTQTVRRRYIFSSLPSSIFTDSSLITSSGGCGMSSVSGVGKANGEKADDTACHRWVHGDWRIQWRFTEFGHGETIGGPIGKV